MIDQEQFRRVVRALPLLRGADAALARDFMRQAYLARIPAGRDVFVEGDRAASIALLLSGSVRVYKIGASGREITLYRFGLGESCVLTANAILSQQTFPAIATVEQDAEAAMVPADVFREWVGRYEAWRSFIFDLLSQRLVEVLEVVDDVVFRRMDARLAAFLAARSQVENPMQITHQEIAAELGSAREVISRLLDDFVHQGWIHSSRGVVEVLDAAALHKRAAV